LSWTDTTDSNVAVVLDLGSTQKVTLEN
jgi:hypothetical protein